MDSDGVVSIWEMEKFWRHQETQLTKHNCVGFEFRDVICVALDLVKALNSNSTPASINFATSSASPVIAHTPSFHHRHQQAATLPHVTLADLRKNAQLSSRFIDIFINWQKLMERENTNGYRLFREIDPVSQRHLIEMCQSSSRSQLETLRDDAAMTEESGVDENAHRETEEGVKSSKASEIQLTATETVSHPTATHSRPQLEGQPPPLPVRELPITDSRDGWSRWVESEYENYIFLEQYEKQRLIKIQERERVERCREQKAFDATVDAAFFWNKTLQKNTFQTLLHAQQPELSQIPLRRDFSQRELMMHDEESSAVSPYDSHHSFYADNDGSSSDEEDFQFTEVEDATEGEMMGVDAARQCHDATHDTSLFQTPLGTASTEYSRLLGLTASHSVSNGGDSPSTAVSFNVWRQQHEALEMMVTDVD